MDWIPVLPFPKGMHTLRTKLKIFQFSVGGRNE